MSYNTCTPGKTQEVLPGVLKVFPDLYHPLWTTTNLTKSLCYDSSSIVFSEVISVDSSEVVSSTVSVVVSSTA